MKVEKNLYRIILFAFVLVLYSCQFDKHQGLVEGENAFNNDWYFITNKSISELENTKAKDMVWVKVCLPHSFNIKTEGVNDTLASNSGVYQKTFFLPQKFKGKQIGVYFEGAMQNVQVYLNDKPIETSQHGYLPFFVDLTHQVNFGISNRLWVVFNNEENSNHHNYSGLYRNVWLQIKEPLYITNAIDGDRPDGGGISVQYPHVSKEEATIHIEVDVVNKESERQGAHVLFTLLDGDAKVTEVDSSPIQILSQHSTSFNTNLKIKQPKLWSPQYPHLYILKVQLMSGTKVYDTKELSIGIRTVEIDKENGLKINGATTKIRGINLHQQYPYIGYALPDQAHFRDAYKIKKAGFNLVRLLHYPHSKAFLDACDSLGIMVVDALPEEVLVKDTFSYENAFTNVRTMVRMDRNHPGIVLWDISSDEFVLNNESQNKVHQIVHDELSGNAVYTLGDVNSLCDVIIRDHKNVSSHHNETEKPALITQYNNEEYIPQEWQKQHYGGQKLMWQQALSIQQEHNHKLQTGMLGETHGLMFGYRNSAENSAEDIEAMNIFRLPKFAYYFYSSQADIGESMFEEFAQLVVYIANFYNDPSFLDITVYSNAQEIELRLNGKSVGRKTPDGNGQYLNHPTFTFQLEAFSPGKLEAIAYVDGKEVARTERNTPGKAHHLKVWVDESGKKLHKGTSDVVFVRAAIVDKEGTILPADNHLVQFSVEGQGKLVGANPVHAEEGIASVLLQVDEDSEFVRITAESVGLESGVYNVRLF